MTLIRTAFANKIENSHLLKFISLVFQQAGPFVVLSYIGLGLSSEQEGVATREEDQKLAAWIETRYTPAG